MPASSSSARTIAIALALAGLVAGSVTVAVAGAEYAGPLIDAHSHLSNAGVIDAYVEAMKRHNVTRVVLLGVGGVQKDDATWLAAASKKYPDRVIAGMPVADPTAEAAAGRLEQALQRTKAPALGEVHMRQVGRRTIDRD